MISIISSSTIANTSATSSGTIVRTLEDFILTITSDREGIGTILLLQPLLVLLLVLVLLLALWQAITIDLVSYTLMVNIRAVGVA